MKLIHTAVVAALLLSGCATGGQMGSMMTATLKCDGPDFNLRDSRGKPVYDEEGMARDGEIEIRMHGATGAHQTRFWNGCLQTWVRIDGKDVMKFYNPNTYEEVAVN